MARYRTIKPDLFSDGALSECCREARYLFVGLLPWVDDMGRRRYSATQLKNEVFPGDTDIDAQRVAYWFRELVQAGVVEQYELGTRKYFRIPNFLRHQRITHPTHTDTPPSPSENGAPFCLCDVCRRSVPAGTSGEFQNPRENSGFLAPRERERELNPKNYTAVKNTHIGASSENAPQTSPLSDLPVESEEDRRTAIRASEEIAKRSLKLLEIHGNPPIISSLAAAIRTKARSKSCTVESAAQQIVARAALLKVESPPDSWPDWIEDSRYEYVPQGDSRLNERQVTARPVCGGAQCSEGWEAYSVNGSRMVRRCGDCRRLWRDLGVT